MLNEDLYLTEASEPLNIIWENRHFSGNDRLIRGLQATALITVLMLASFMVIYLCKSTSITISDTYDVDDCTTINAAYGTSLEHYAFDEYYNYTANSDTY